MPIVVTCPGCPTKLSAPDNAAGKQIRCPKCGATAPVPNLIPAEAVEEEVVEATVAKPKPKPKPVQAEADDDPPPRKKPAGRDNDADPPRPKKKKRRYDDDDDDYDHDHRRRRSGGGNGGKIAAIVIVGLLVLAGIGIGIYFLAGKGGSLAKKAPPPPGWKQYTYEKDGFKAYFPNEPASFSVNGLQLGNLGGGFGRNDLNELEGVATYSSMNLDGQGNAQVLIYRFRNRVPSSVRDNVRDLNPRQFGQGEKRSVRWLGYSGEEITTKEGVVRIVCADRMIVAAGVTGPNGGRAKPEIEDGFFDNFELTK